ncbi:MAG: hypothetical protein WCP91_03965 [Candidatus Berkelbacteria bacterium]
MTTASLPETINANVFIKTDTKDNLNSYIVPLGEMVYATDEKTLRIGDGINFGGSLIKNRNYFVSRTSSASRNGLLDENTNLEANLDSVLKLTIQMNPNEVTYYKGKCQATFMSGGIGSATSSPIVYMYNLFGRQYSYNIKLIQIIYDYNAANFSFSDKQKTLFGGGGLLSSIGNEPRIYIDEPLTYEQTNTAGIFFFESEFYFSSNIYDASDNTITIGCAWASNGSTAVSILNGILEVQQIQ